MKLCPISLYLWMLFLFFGNDCSICVLVSQHDALHQILQSPANCGSDVTETSGD